MDPETPDRTPDSDRPARQRYFGRRLRELRDSYAQRLNQADMAPILHATTSASALIECMRRETGYAISSAAYNEVENGLNIPRDAARFLDSVARCLRLSPEEKHDLTRRLAYDLISNRLQHLTAEVFPPDPDWG